MPRPADANPDDRPRPAERRIPAIVARPARMLALAYLGLMLVLSALQTQLIFPGRLTQGMPTAEVRPGPGVERLELRARGGERVVAVFGPALTAGGAPRPDAARRPTVLYFYGNGDCLAGSLDAFESFRRLGANVMIADYLGYGLSEGEPGERGCYDAADAALAHLRGRPDVAPERIIAAGWSLGGAVAVDLASREALAGLAVFSSFTSMGDMVRQVYPIPGLGLLLKHRFDSLRKIRRIGCPTVIGHGSDDRIVPAWMSERLAEAAAGPVSRFRVRSDHNDFFWIGRDRIDAEMGRLIERVAESE